MLNLKIIIMSKVFTMGEGLQTMWQAFPEDRELLNEEPSLASVFTACEKTIHFCLVSYAKGFYYVKEMLSEHSYKTNKLSFYDMNSGTRYENLTAVECNGKAAILID